MLDFLVFTRSGFPNHLVEFVVTNDNGRLVWELFQRTKSYDLEHRRSIWTTEKSSQWQVELARINLHSWMDNYDDSQILDGLQWSVFYKDQNETYKASAGSNEYPEIWGRFVSLFDSQIAKIPLIEVLKDGEGAEYRYDIANKIYAIKEKYAIKKKPRGVMYSLTHSDKKEDYSHIIGRYKTGEGIDLWVGRDSIQNPNIIDKSSFDKGSLPQSLGKDLRDLQNAVENTKDRFITAKQLSDESHTTTCINFVWEGNYYALHPDALNLNDRELDECAVFICERLWDIGSIYAVVSNSSREDSKRRNHSQ